MAKKTGKKAVAHVEGATLQIDLAVVARLEEKGINSSSIISAMFALHKAGLPMDDEKLIRHEIENGEQSRSANECQVCLDATINSVLLPCRHSTLCHDCAEDINASTKECPMCMSPIEGVLQLFTP